MAQHARPDEGERTSTKKQHPCTFFRSKTEFWWGDEGGLKAQAQKKEYMT